eukprot:CAMPEP_0180240180 /NCGR_PEP_ID=MMETSP0987-20121128/31950_1 /TAXON_ID=697907 /ORGANISM="non described non described, Strain CCMP2293" /LENGTH=86 /DNA_ID=CAMNT_0022207005 /DNA_START=1 /DNA_END=261 /DNA_ORIENTATION=+
MPQVFMRQVFMRQVHFAVGHTAVLDGERVAVRARSGGHGRFEEDEFTRRALGSEALLARGHAPLGAPEDGLQRSSHRAPAPNPRDR